MDAKARNGPIVYIASALSGDIEGNTIKTRGYSLFAIMQGAVPINPILNLTGVLDEKSDREMAMSIDLALLQRSDEIWIFGIPTEGMMAEIDEAERCGKRLRWFTEELEEL